MAVLVSLRATDTPRGAELRMPFARYFLFAGGALLLVLLVAAALLPSTSAVERVATQRAAIRIHSEMKLPERVVFDTSTPPATHHAETVPAESSAPASLPTNNEVTANARQAFAQMQSSDLNKAKLAGLKRSALKPHLRKSETRIRPATSRKVRLARQPQFDWFGGRMWW